MRVSPVKGRISHACACDLVCTHTDLYVAFTRIPTIRPKVAPTAMEGTKIPAGTFAPYDMMIKTIRKTVASKSEFTIRHWAQVLEGQISHQIPGYHCRVEAYWHKLS